MRTQRNMPDPVDDLLMTELVKGQTVRQVAHTAMLSPSAIQFRIEDLRDAGLLSPADRKWKSTKLTPMGERYLRERGLYNDGN